MAERLLSRDTPMEFFRTRLLEAMARQRVSMSAFTEYYLVSLLTGCIRSERLPAREPGYTETPLALLYARALEAPRGERARRLRGLGDAALFITGFFPDSYLGCAVDHRYYRKLGGRAYAHLSREERTRLAPDVFGELSQRFSEFADVISEVAEMTRQSDMLPTAQVYERWRQTGSVRSARELARRGVSPADPGEWLH